jgi:hypothetical protein
VAEPPPVVDDEPIEDAPRDVEFDAAAELDRIHQAAAYSATPEHQDDKRFDDSYGIGGYPPQQPMRYDPVVAPRQEPEEPAAPLARELHTLEDLYTAYPEIGGGNFYLRVYRKHPTNFGGIRCAGFIEDVHEQISMQDFVSRYGGHTYEVLVRGPGSRSSTLDADGRTQLRTLCKVRLDIPGPPNLKQNSSGQDPMMQHQQQPFFGRQNDHPQVEMKRLDIEAEDRRRRDKRESDLRAQAYEGSQVPPDLFMQMEKAASARGDEARTAAQEVIMSLKRQLDRNAERCTHLEEKNQELRESMMTQQMEMNLKLKEEESRQVRELKERHGSEIGRVNTDHANTIQRMEAEHRRSTKDITEAAQRERDHIQKMEQMERERIRNDAQRREETMLNDHSRRERENRESADSRIKELERSHDREVRGVRDMRDREVESIRSSEKSHSKFSEKTAEVQVSVMQGENARLSATNESLSRELETANGRLNKPPLEAVREAHEIASMTGFKGGADEEESFDWKKGLFKAVGNLIDKGPEMAKGLGEAREQNRVAVAQANHRARIAQQRATAASQRRAMSASGPQMAPQPPPSSPQQQHRPPPPPGVVPQRTWDDPAGPPEPGAAVGPPVAGAPVMDVEQAHHIHSSPPEGPQAPPFGGGRPMPTMQASLAQPTEEASPPQTGEPPPPPPPPVALVSPEPDEPAEITPEMVSKFSEQLELAISSGMVTAEQFAKKFVDEAGVSATRTIINSIGPDQLVEAVAAEAGGDKTSIVTRAGRKFVQELWVEVHKLIDHV